MSDYTYDVFVSYKRLPLWQSWIDRHFQSMLFLQLGKTLGKANPKIFIDRESLSEGREWPRELAHCHSRSRVLVPLFCAHYWESDWCKTELAMMLERERIVGRNAQNHLTRLIIPVIIHDGDRIPAEISEIQSFKAHEFAKLHLTRKRGFEDMVEALAQRIADTIPCCPPFDPSWESATCDAFRNLLCPAKTSTSFPRLA